MPFMPPKYVTRSSCQPSSSHSAFPYRKLVASAMLSGAAFASAGSYAATLSFDEENLTFDEPNSGSRVVAVTLRASFDDGAPSWNNLSSCTVTGTVEVAPREDRVLGQAVAGVDFVQQTQTFSMTTQPYQNEQGQVVIDEIADQILFEIIDDGDETEASEEINFKITDYGVTCDDGSERGLTGYGSYGSLIINDPFDEKDISRPSVAIPVRQKSLSSQLSSLRTLSLHNSATRDRSIAQELERARKGPRSRMDNLQVNVKGQNLPVGALMGGAAGDALDDFGRWGFFITGTVDFGKQEKDLANESDFDTSMLIAGLDYHLSNNVILGASLTRTDTDAGSDRTANTDLNTNSLSVFGSVYSADSFYVDAIVTYGSSGYDLDRQIAKDDGSFDVGAADTDGDETTGALGAGYNIHHQNLNVRLFSLVHYIDANIDGYSETVYGTSSAATVDGVDLQSLTANLGVELSWNINSNMGVFTPMLSLAQEHQFADDAVDITGRFVGGLDAGEFYYHAPDRDEDYLNASVGLNAVFRNGLTAFFSYETALKRDDLASNRLSLGARWQF